VGLLLLGLAVGAYVGARETSVFAVRTLEISGGSPSVQDEVRAALAPELGRSLVQIGGEEIARRIAPIPSVLSVRYDRAFPHTLQVIVTPERPVLMLRRGIDGWAVSARGRVIGQAEDARAGTLPRVFVTKETSIEPGEFLPSTSGGLAAAALAPLASAGFPEPLRLVRAGEDELTFVLRSGLEVRLGDIGDLRLKLAVAAKILGVIGSEQAEGYVDVSVPERPVVGT
jgi:cell division protein FtsQ